MKPTMSQLPALGAVPPISAPTEAIIASFTLNPSWAIVFRSWGINRQCAVHLGGILIKKWLFNFLLLNFHLKCLRDFTEICLLKMKISCSNWPIDILSRTIRDRDQLIMLREDRELSSFLGPFYPCCHCNHPEYHIIIDQSSGVSRWWKYDLEKIWATVCPTLITSDIEFLWTKCEAAIISSLGNGFWVPRWREKKTLAVASNC